MHAPGVYYTALYAVVYAFSAYYTAVMISRGLRYNTQKAAFTAGGLD